MQATVGDRLIVNSNRVGAPEAGGEIVAVHGDNGRPPFLVQWDDGHESLFSPRADTTVRQRRRRGGA